jgi:phage-related protein (TIGR01555 family)
MGAVTFLRDRLANIMSGAGTSNDPRTQFVHVFDRLSWNQVEATYRSNWLMRNAVDIPAYDMTRAWRDWQAAKDQIETIEAEEKRLGLRQKVREAIILGRLGGGALILGLGDQPDQPLPATIGKGALKYVHVISRYRLSIGAIIRDPSSEWFGEPEYFQLNSGADGVKIHPSRVIAFKGLPVPEISMAWAEDCYWGDPVAQAVLDAINNATAASNGFASLIEKARVGVLKVPDLMTRWATDEHEQAFMKRLALANQGASNHQMTVIDALEDWQQFQVTWAGMPDVIKTYLSIVAGATQIPATRLLGKAPDGMNATGEGDLRNYDTMISGRQENELRPLLDRVDGVMLPSLGVTDPDVGFAFAPLSVLSEKEKADIGYVKARPPKFTSTPGWCRRSRSKRGS